MSLLPSYVHASWTEFLDQEILSLLERIEEGLPEQYNPDREKVLRFLTTDLTSLKVVVLGQDPYPEKGVATGRAFEVGTLESWDKPFRQVSLKNLIRLVYKTYQGIENYKEIPPFSRIVQEIRKGSFPLPDPRALFSHWEKEGVLFLNTSFTVEPGNPLSHAALWNPFTKRLLPWISLKNQNLCWFLWGKSAQEYKTLIQNGKIYESRHPMMCAEVYADDFLKSDCIKDTMKFVNWTGN